MDPAKTAPQEAAPGPVVAEPLFDDRSLPLLIRPAGSEADVASWAANNRPFLDASLRKHGAILFRGFDVQSVEDFERLIVAASSDDWVEYREAATPRSHVSGHVFTSTEYSAKNRIYLHNENSHVTSWPAKLFFYCRTPAETGGETPIADCRRVFDRLEPAARDRFVSQGWLYARAFGYGLGFPWQTVFNARTPEEVNEYCQQNDMLPHWDGNRLKVRYRRWAALKHPRTGEMTWFNHGTFYNVWTLEPSLKAAVKMIGEDRMPFNTYYGDGSRVEDGVLAMLDAAYHAEAVTFSWRAGDVLMLDNMLAAHGRQPFTGKREVFVGMTELVRCQDVCSPDQYAPPG